MITFKEFLAEEEKKVHDLASLLRDNCQPFLKQAGGYGLLYRGMKSRRSAEEILYAHDTNDDAIFEVTVMKAREDRRPSDLPYRFHEMADRWFEKQFDWKPRSQGVFCYGTGAKWAASGYGSPYMIFPIGNFEFVYSAEMADLYGSVEGAHYFAPRGKDTSAAEQEQAFTKFLDNKNYTDRQLHRGMESEAEIMLKCSKYYAISVRNEKFVQSVIDKL